MTSKHITNMSLGELWNKAEELEEVTSERDTLTAELVAARAELEKLQEQTGCCSVCMSNAWVMQADEKTQICEVCKLRTHNALLRNVAETLQAWQRERECKGYSVRDVNEAPCLKALTAARQSGALEGGKG